MTTYRVPNGHGFGTVGQIALLEDPIESQFREFHHANPEVYNSLVARAREWKQQGHRKCGIGMLFEIFRWQSGITFGPNEGFKLNNNFRSRYARLIMSNERDLDGFFETRQLDANEVY